MNTAKGEGTYKHYLILSQKRKAITSPPKPDFISPSETPESGPDEQEVAVLPNVISPNGRDDIILLNLES